MDLSTAFAIVGSLLSNSIAFLLPCCFYIKLTKKKNIYYILAWAILYFGIIMAFVSIIGTILKKISSSNSNSNSNYC